MLSQYLITSIKFECEAYISMYFDPLNTNPGSILTSWLFVLCWSQKYLKNERKQRNWNIKQTHHYICVFLIMERGMGAIYTKDWKVSYERTTVLPSISLTSFLWYTMEKIVNRYNKGCHGERWGTIASSVVPSYRQPTKKAK